VRSLRQRRGDVIHGIAFVASDWLFPHLALAFLCSVLSVPESLRWCCSTVTVLLNQTPPEGIWGICPHVSYRPTDQTTLLGHLSRFIAAEVRKLHLRPMLIICEHCVSDVPLYWWLYSEITLSLTTVTLNQCMMDIDDRPHGCLVCDTRAWFICPILRWCLEMGLALSTGAEWVGSTWRWRQNAVSEIWHIVLNKDRTMDNVQKHGNHTFLFSCSLC
jgi:hypothetical protein